jgi:predicted DNA-binding transcriptional regulator AlpA
MVKIQAEKAAIPAPKLSRLLNEEQVAEPTGLSLATLRRWRVLGTGPKFRKLGAGPKSPVRYDPADLEAWIAFLPSGGNRNVA